MAESPRTAKAKPERLVSLDAFRGFVMLAMASSGGFGLAYVVAEGEHRAVFQGTAWTPWWEWLCQNAAWQLEHIPWRGCAFWDLIQPSFMFMVGVALPYSVANRTAAGQSGGWQFLHVLWRSLVLILLGVFLSSNGATQTNFTFVNVLTQIGLGYPIVWLLLKRGRIVQLVVATIILAGYWYLFYQHPLPPANFDWSPYRLDRMSPNWRFETGLAAHWNIHTNYAAAFDQWLLNLPYFPREKPFEFNGGGYQTLNFIPSIVTMLLGLMTGEWLRSETATRHQKLGWMVLYGGVCLLAGLALDGKLWPFYPLDYSLCPIVKRIWTPSWTLLSTGWVLWMLSGFYWLIDIRGWKSWAFPFVVVGMNSIAMYVMAQLLKPWVQQTLKTHLGQDRFEFPAGGMVLQMVTLGVLWLICLWMYRNKFFVKV